MNRRRIEAHWRRLLGRIKSQWGRLSDDALVAMPAGAPHAPTRLTRVTGRVGAKPAPAAPDAIAQLSAGHQALELLFFEYERALTRKDRKALLVRICRVLSLQLQVEEEVFYPAVRNAWRGVLQMPEVLPAHAELRSLIGRLQVIGAFADLPTAVVGALAASVRLHVRDSQAQLFPQARAAALDLRLLGMRMAKRRDELLARESS